MDQAMPIIDPSEYVKRRQRFCQQMLDDAIAIIPAATQAIRNGDAHYAYRQDSDFYYLTGFNEPDAVLILLKQNQHTILFNRPPDPLKESWEGRRLGQQQAVKELHVDQAYPIQELEQYFARHLPSYQHIYYYLGRHVSFDKYLLPFIAQERKQNRAPFSANLLDIGNILNEMRLIKSPSEIALMRVAADISAQAHLSAMQACKPGLFEYQLEAEIAYTLLHNNCRAMAYPAIIGGGANACILHYSDNSAELINGDLVLIDAAGEYKGYAADITRTFPINGKFSGEQRALYELVLAAQMAGIAVVKPGTAWSEIQQRIVRVITQGLVDLGILKGSVDDLIAIKAYQNFYRHNSGHWLGLDVHDVGSYQNHNISRALIAGMALTVEPGIYIEANTPNVDPRWWNIGIRIEDDIVVTQIGCDILSKRAPKDIAEIESIMADHYGE
jgi:Xaa-Pro aminopeptidase